MYRLLKYINNSNANHYITLVKDESLDIISKEMRKRISDGCPSNSLLVVKDIPFELQFDIHYKEESNGYGTT